MLIISALELYRGVSGFHIDHRAFCPFFKMACNFTKCLPGYNLGKSFYTFHVALEIQRYCAD
jgi:hypothetical protein